VDSEKMKFPPSQVVVTSKSLVSTLLFVIGQKGQWLNQLNILYIPQNKPHKEDEFDKEKTVLQLLEILSDSFGWYEIERKQEEKDFEGVNQYGLKQPYKATVWNITIEKHGALRHK
jgi:hypothetical protein